MRSIKENILTNPRFEEKVIVKVYNPSERGYKWVDGQKVYDIYYLKSQEKEYSTFIEKESSSELWHGGKLIGHSKENMIPLDSWDDLPDFENIQYDVLKSLDDNSCSVVAGICGIGEALNPKWNEKNKKGIIPTVIKDFCESHNYVLSDELLKKWMVS